MITKVTKGLSLVKIEVCSSKLGSGRISKTPQGLSHNHSDLFVIFRELPLPRIPWGMLGDASPRAVHETGNSGEAIPECPGVVWGGLQNPIALQIPR